RRPSAREDAGVSPMTRRELKRIDAELRKVQVRLERELRESGVDAKLVELKAEIKRAKNRLRMRCVRDGTWSVVKALSGMPLGELKARLRELLRDPRPGPSERGLVDSFAKSPEGKGARKRRD